VRGEKYKERLREREYELIASSISDVVGRKSSTLKILEFGCGPGGGIEHLRKLGQLCLIDINKNKRLTVPADVKFFVADIRRTDFGDGEFDIVVSNQVLEYLGPKDAAFSEMKRIAKPDAYFVFSVPTAVWLILATPGQIQKKVANVLVSMLKTNKNGERTKSNASGGACRRQEAGFLNKFAVTGHGFNPQYSYCLREWRKRNWAKTLSSNDFEIVYKAPLLSYGSSHLPLIPPNRLMARLGLSSSYLFICKKRR